MLLKAGGWPSTNYVALSRELFTGRSDIDPVAWTSQTDLNPTNVEELENYIQWDLAHGHQPSKALLFVGPPFCAYLMEFIRNGNEDIIKANMGKESSQVTLDDLSVREIMFLLRRRICTAGYRADTVETATLKIGRLPCVIDLTRPDCLKEFIISVHSILQHSNKKGTTVEILRAVGTRLQTVANTMGILKPLVDDILQPLRTDLSRHVNVDAWMTELTKRVMEKRDILESVLRWFPQGYNKHTLSGATFDHGEKRKEGEQPYSKG